MVLIDSFDKAVEDKYAWKELQCSSENKPSYPHQLPFGSCSSPEKEDYNGKSWVHASTIPWSSTFTFLFFSSCTVELYVVVPKDTVFFSFSAGSSIASDFLFGENSQISYEIISILRQLVPYTIFLMCWLWFWTEFLSEVNHFGHLVMWRKEHCAWFTRNSCRTYVITQCSKFWGYFFVPVLFWQPPVANRLCITIHSGGHFIVKLLQVHIIFPCGQWNLFSSFRSCVHWFTNQKSQWDYIYYLPKAIVSYSDLQDSKRKLF